MKTVRITNDDLYRILAGREIAVEGDIKLRLYTADELIAESENAQKDFPDLPKMRPETAENLTRTHDLYAMLEEIKERNRRNSAWLTEPPFTNNK